MLVEQATQTRISHPEDAGVQQTASDEGMVVRFGVFEVDLRAGELRKKGMKVGLQDKPFQMLAALLEQSGRLVTREELRERLWPANTFVDFDGSLNTAAGKLRDALGDSAKTPRYLETLPRRGYRFIAPVGPLSAKTNTYPLPSVEFASGNHQQSIAVLPFANLSSDSEQEVFCDGMTEELINALAQLPSLHVVARTSAFAFKRLHRDIRQIGQELGARTVVEGTVRRADDRLRITAQLIDTGNGYHLWSQPYDRKLTNIFAIQEEVAQAIADTVRVRLAGQADVVTAH